MKFLALAFCGLVLLAAYPASALQIQNGLDPKTGSPPGTPDAAAQKAQKHADGPQHGRRGGNRVSDDRMDDTVAPDARDKGAEARANNDGSFRDPNGEDTRRSDVPSRDGRLIRSGRVQN
jgi:hypothetical protein